MSIEQGMIGQLYRPGCSKNRAMTCALAWEGPKSRVIFKRESIRIGDSGR
jgi:hypothetical protein